MTELTIKDHIKGNAYFQYYRKGDLYYRTDSGLDFRVPIADTGDGTFLKEDRAITLMRYIRKELEDRREDG